MNQLINHFSTAKNSLGFLYFMYLIKLHVFQCKSFIISYRIMSHHTTVSNLSKPTSDRAAGLRRGAVFDN